MNNRKKPELLCPASSLEVLKTAFYYGADAVYIGGEMYSLRARAKNFSMEDIAQMCNISSVYFRRMFKEFMGVSPSQYRIQKRIEKAKMLLEYGEHSIESIAQDLGYIDTSYFIKQFKEKVGLTPHEYRKMQ